MVIILLKFLFVAVDVNQSFKFYISCFTVLISLLKISRSNFVAANVIVLIFENFATLPMFVADRKLIVT